MVATEKENNKDTKIYKMKEKYRSWQKRTEVGKKRQKLTEEKKNEEKKMTEKYGSWHENKEVDKKIKNLTEKYRSWQKI